MVSLVLTLWLGAAVAAEPCVAFKDDSPYRTCFDPGERIEVSVGPSFGNQPVAGTLTGAIRLRKNRRSHHDPGLLWNRDHTILEAHLELPQMSFDKPQIEATAYQGVFIRRYEEGALVVPVGSNPLRIPFPFDVGIEAEVGRFFYDRADPDHARLGVLRAAPVLDAARRIPGAYRFAFGPELSYALGLQRSGAPRHSITPFSGGVVDLRFETDDGLWVGTIRGRVAYELEVKGPGRLAWSAGADLERVLFAIDDRPLAPYVHFEASGDGSPIRLVGQVGLRLAAQL